MFLLACTLTIHIYPLQSFSTSSHCSPFYFALQRFLPFDFFHVILSYNNIFVFFVMFNPLTFTLPYIPLFNFVTIKSRFICALKDANFSGSSR
jgi:hypothetical protein